MKLIVRIFLLLLPVLILILTLGFVYQLMHQHKTLKKRTDDESYRKVVAEYVLAEKKDKTLYIHSQGLVYPRTEINLITEVSGRITYLSDKFQKGSGFKKGDILLKIEDKDYQSHLLQKKANLKQTEQALIREQAEAQIALQDWKEFGSQKQPSDLALRKPQLEQAKARILSSQAEVKNAEIQLGRTIIRAPFTGQVRSREVGEGQYTSAGRVLGKIFSTHIAEVELPLTDQDISYLDIPITFQATDQHQGPETLLSGIFAGKKHQWVGHLARVDSALDNQTRTLQAIIEVKDPYGKGASHGTPLIPGLFVEGQIQGRSLKQAFVLPISALHEKSLLYKINDKDEILVVKTNVITTTKDYVIVDKNIKTGDKIVVTALYGVFSGLKVKPLLKQEQNDQKRVINITNEYIHP